MGTDAHADTATRSPIGSGAASAAPWWKPWRLANKRRLGPGPALTRPPSPLASSSPAGPASEEDAFLKRLRQAGL